MSAAVAENPRGIPKADFVEDIPGLMEKTSLTAAELIEQADTQYNKVRAHRLLNRALENTLVPSCCCRCVCACVSWAQRSQVGWRCSGGCCCRNGEDGRRPLSTYWHSLLLFICYF